MATYLWRTYADYLYTKWEKELLWMMVDPYKRPKSFTPLVSIYVSAFYTGVIGAAVTEQLHKASPLVPSHITVVLSAKITPFWVDREESDDGSRSLWIVCYD